MEERATLCKSVRQGFVEFAELRLVLSDLTELWPSIRPFIRCTGNSEAKDKAERVSPDFCVCSSYHIRYVFVVIFCLLIFR